MRPNFPWTGVVAGCIYVIFVAVGLLLGGIGIARAGDTFRVATSSISHAVGTVEAKFVDHDEVWYTFHPTSGPEVVTGRTRVSSDEWSAAELGSPIDIDYATADPRTNYAAGHSPVLDDAVAAAFGIGISALVIITGTFRYRPNALWPALRRWSARRA